MYLRWNYVDVFALLEILILQVQSVGWHPTEAWLLATGAFDKTIGLIDARSATTTTACTLGSDIESLTWDPFNPFHLYCALEDGTIVCIDVRNCGNKGATAAGEKSKKSKKNDAINFTFQAHDQTTSGVSFSQRVPGMMATASIDKTVKVWDVSDLQSSEAGGPRLVAYKTMNVGKLFALQYNPDDPFLLAAAGDTGMVAVWESDELETIESYFKQRVVPSKSTYSNLQQTTNNSSNNSSSNDASNSSSSGMVADSTVGAFASTGKFDSVEMAIAEKEDESWMDDNTGIESAAGEDKKKKKSKKLHKEKKEKH